MTSRDQLLLLCGYVLGSKGGYVSLPSAIRDIIHEVTHPPVTGNLPTPAQIDEALSLIPPEKNHTTDSDNDPDSREAITEELTDIVIPKSMVQPTPRAEMTLTDEQRIDAYLAENPTPPLNQTEKRAKAIPAAH